MKDEESAFSPRWFSLVGKTALITGATRGIGLALGSACASAGARLVLVGRDPLDVGNAASLIEAAGGDVIARRIDVSDVTSIDAAFASLAAENIELDIWVNNAGVEEVCASIDVDEPIWDKVVDTNLKGAFFCARAFARLPHRGGPRSIVNLCSLTSAVGIPTAVPYSSSKTGLVGLTRALSAEWATLGIRVNGIGPGYFRTAMTESFYADPAWTDAMRRKIPLGRFGKLDDFAECLVFLCSPAASYITGQVIYVDGGTLAAL